MNARPVVNLDRQRVKETYDLVGEPIGKFSAMRAYLDDLEKTYANLHDLEIEADHCVWITYTLTGWRWETDEEMANRIEMENFLLDIWLKKEEEANMTQKKAEEKQRAADLAELNRLKKKLGVEG